ncbi:response regulator transcription factor [Anaerotignum lactatifermentans]|uniref:Stage 0 sporulation protein A homolog n=1 Tax=Anaerotignum lactatifermentans TaxID=160404 RepID=A0ABS2G704_9FIRM|nr:response regulator transcription factor [Anaerotignum lactatifermentans]MBM6828190.1 response regulator transcription factor [Anaerotignum lactatifermentans]MBM6876647.1 response regulator transcription factor [Anaerotignum lactatifermentans]MBM6949773.1 response regulator transcription factor [Anaerotignum lactatifermentans]
MIYLVEDDKSIRELVAYTLNSAGLEAEGFERPSEFWAACEKNLPDLVLLDIMLPEEDGIQILQKLRQKEATKRMPVIMLTAKGSEYDKVFGLENGADDYVAKPFGMMELLARVKALLRRTEDLRPKAEEKVYRLEELEVHVDQYRVLSQGEEVALTRKEFEMLCYLLENRGRVLTRDQLLNKIWGYAFDGENRTVDVHIRTLRQKLGQCGKYIETIRGIGYKIGGNG